MTFNIAKGTKSKQKLRLAISGPSGTGKTYSSLLLAQSLGCKRICVVDTERGSSHLYGDKFEFDVLELDAPYSPSRYIEALSYVSKQDYDCVVIDSASHEWEGTGGCLDMHSKIPGNSYTAWAKITPLHTAFLEKLISMPLHVIVTTRAKVAYVLEADDKGKMVPREKGMESKQRDGFKYEFTTMFELDQNHCFTCSKDRSGLFVNTEIPEPFNETVGERLHQWLNEGTTPAAKVNDDLKAVIAEIVEKLNKAKDTNEVLDIKEDWDLLKKASPEIKEVTINYVEKLIKEKENF